MGERVQVVTENFLRGLIDTQPERGLEYPGLSVAQDVRFGRNTGLRRAGMLRVAVTATLDQAALEFSGTGQYLSAPAAPVHALPPLFVLEALVKPDSAAAGLDYIVGWGHATDFPVLLYRSGDTWHYRVKSSAVDINGNTDHAGVTAGAATHLRLVVTPVSDDIMRTALYVNGSQLAGGDTSATGAGAITSHTAPGGALQIGAHQGADEFDGVIDYVRAFSRTMPDFAYAYQRWPHPKGRYVLMDYYMKIDSFTQVPDHSRHMNTMRPTGSPSTATSLCVRSAPGQGILGFKDRQNVPRVAAVIGGVPFAPSI